MNKKNIFKNAYFGKPYKTRDGEKAIYLRECFKYHLYLETGGIIECNRDGTYEGVLGRIEHLDIVSEWQEPINEEELDKMAYDYADYNVDEDEDMRKVMCHFKAGYRKGKQE